MTPLRATAVFRAATNIGETIVHILVGLILMAGGGAIIRYAMLQKTLSNVTLFTGVGVAILGALFMPTIFPLFKQIVVLVVPYLPIVGGKRAGDPPAPPSGGTT